VPKEGVPKEGVPREGAPREGVPSEAAPGTRTIGSGRCGSRDWADGACPEGLGGAGAAEPRPDWACGDWTWDACASGGCAGVGGAGVRGGSGGVGKARVTLPCGAGGSAGWKRKLGGSRVSDGVSSVLRRLNTARPVLFADVSRSWTAGAAASRLHAAAPPDKPSGRGRPGSFGAGGRPCAA